MTISKFDINKVPSMIIDNVLLNLIILLNQNHPNRSILKVATYKFLRFTSHGSNSQEIFLSHQLISVALHGSSFHLADVYVPNSVEHFSSSSKVENSYRHNH